MFTCLVAFSQPIALCVSAGVLYSAYYFHKSYKYKKIIYSIIEHSIHVTSPPHASSGVLHSDSHVTSLYPQISNTKTSDTSLPEVGFICQSERPRLWVVVRGWVVVGALLCAMNVPCRRKLC